MKTMLRFLLSLGLWLTASHVAAQPANDNCTAAQVYTPNGGCLNGTTTGANDSWIGSVGCQTGGSHNDVWYQFTATDNQLNFTVTGTGMGNNIEVIVAYSPCGDCNCSFQIHGNACGPSPLTDSVVGLNVGGVYYVTISSSGAAGNFQFCSNLVQAVGTPGQDCPNASPICNENPFSTPTVASGNGTIRGNGSQEDISAITGGCFGADERQSQWYRFTASVSGTIEFNINPNVNSDDYDWILLNTTAAGCNLIAGAPPVVECDWSGCDGATGMSSSPSTEPGVVTSGAGCFGGPAAFEPPGAIVAGQTYLLLIDNFSISNNGFSFTWGGVNNTMTGAIGPSAVVGFTTTIVGCNVTIGGVTAVPNYTYGWTWGDGATASGTAPGSHTFAPGTYTITQTITDAIGCEAVTSRTVVVCLPLAADDITFEASFAGGASELHWAMPEMVEATEYILLRSRDAGASFDLLANLDATAQSMQYRDETPYPGTTWYQVQALDVQGEAHFSALKAVMTDVNGGLSVAPNPTNGELGITLGNLSTPQVARLFDVSGRVVLSAAVSQARKGSGSINLSELRPGIYWLEVETDLGLFHTRVIKN